MREGFHSSNVWPPEDRLWRHPSERAKHPTYVEQSVQLNQLRRARRQIMLSGGVIVGFSLAISLTLLQTMGDPRAPRQAFQPSLAASTANGLGSGELTSTTVTQPTAVLAGLNQ